MKYFKGDLTMSVFYNNKQYSELIYSLEADFEKDIMQNSKPFFGFNSIYIDAKKKIGTTALGGAIPDGFLFNFSDKDNPEFYLVEVELSKHSFWDHIFPQITKFLAFFQNQDKINELVGKIYNLIDDDQELKDGFVKYTDKSEIFKFIKDIIENNQNILLILDNEKEEIEEVMETYSEWADTVKKLVVKKYTLEDDNIYSVHPDFQDIELPEIPPEDTRTARPLVVKTEDDHLNRTSQQIRDVYLKIKAGLLQYYPSITFNAKTTYISIANSYNIVYFRFTRKDIGIVLAIEEDEAKKALQKHSVTSLIARHQIFWTGKRPSCELHINNGDDIKEVIDLIVRVIKENQ